MIIWLKVDFPRVFVHAMTMLEGLNVYNFVGIWVVVNLYKKFVYCIKVYLKLFCNGSINKSSQVPSALVFVVFIQYVELVEGHLKNNYY